MKTYFKTSSFSKLFGVLIGIGLTTVSCTSLNSSYYDTDGIYSSAKVRPATNNYGDVYYDGYFENKLTESYEIFTDIDTYSSYETGNNPGWGENNSTTNIFINTGYNSNWGWNNYGYGGGYWGMGYNSYFGWNTPSFGFGFGYGWGSPYYGGWGSPYYGGWGYPYYSGGYGWGYPYYGYGNYNRRNVSYSSNTRTASNGYRNISSNTRGSNNLNRNSRAIIQDSRNRVNRMETRNSVRTDSRNVRPSEIRTTNTRENIRTSNTRTNIRNYNNSTPTRNSTISAPSRPTSSPAPRMGGSSSGGGRMSSGRR